MNQVSGASISIAPGVAVFENQLYCFYQGPNNNGELNYSLCTTDWTWSNPPAPLNMIELSGSPTGAYCNNTLFCLYPDDGLLFCSLYDSTESVWSPPFPLPNVYPLGSACAVAYTPPSATADQLYIFYQSGSSGQVGELWYVTYDPSSGVVSAPTQVSGVNMMGNPSALVFTPSGSTSAQLYVFYQSSGGCSYSVFDGTSWTAGTTGIELANSPSATVFSDQIYVFYQGATNNGLYYTLSSGSSWSAPSSLPSTSLSGSPSAAAFNGSLYVFHLSSGGTELYHNVLTGSTWAGDTQVSSVDMSNSPGAVATSNQLYVFYEGPSDNEQLWYSVMGTTGSWGSNTFLQPQSSATGPAAVSYNNVMYCFYESYGQLCYSINPGGTNFWTTQMLVPGVTLTGAPSAVLFNDLFYIFYQSATGGQLWYVTYNNSTSTWSTPAQVAGVTMSGSPSAAVYSNQLYVFYQDSSEQVASMVFSGIAWTSGTVPNSDILGSPSAVVFNGSLYVFHQWDGAPYYTVFNGSLWAVDVAIPGYPVISGSPSATALIDQICVAFQGSGNDGILYYMTFNGSAWSGATQVSGVTMTGSPAAAALNNYSLWVIYGNASGQLSYTVCSGQNSWNAQLKPSLPNWTDSYLNSVIPAPVVFNSELYVFFQGGQSNGEMWYISSSNGSSWNGGTATNIAYTGMSGSPSPVVFNNKLYVFHMGSDLDGQLYCNVMSTDGSWGGDTCLNPTSESVWAPMWSGENYVSCLSPSAVVFNGQIYCFFNQGEAGSNGSLTYVTLSTSESLTGGTIDLTANLVNPSDVGPFVYMSPAAVVFNNQLYVFWQQEGGTVNTGTRQLFYTVSSDGSSWSNITQAGSAGAKAGSNILAVIGNQAEAIVAPFVDNYLVPDNLLNTAVLKAKEGGGVEWVTPTYKVATA